MHIQKNYVLKRNENKPIVIDWFLNSDKNNQPFVIFCHGYKGFKDWGAWNTMARTIAQAGFCFLKFNFSHNGGTVENPIDFPDLEAFGNNNYTKELDDLNDVLDWVGSKFQNNPIIDTSKIYLIGHSRGGGIAILKTTEDQRIKKLITLASVCDFGKRTSTTGDLETWKKDGVKYVVNGRTKQQMPHYYQFYEDFKANESHLNIQNATKKIAVPQLIIHGNADSSVSINEGHKLHKWNPEAKFEIIENADHVFNVRHPWQKDEIPVAFAQVIETIIRFLK